MSALQAHFCHWQWLAVFLISVCSSQSAVTSEIVRHCWLWVTTCKQQCSECRDLLLSLVLLCVFGFQVYVAEVTADIVMCTKRNTHKRKQAEIQKVHCSVFLTLSLPILLTLYTLTYWSNPPFLIFDIWMLWHLGLSTKVPGCQKLQMVG